MATQAYQQLALEWQPSSANERTFYKFGAIALCLALMLAYLLSIITVPEQARRVMPVVPERIAHFIEQKPKPIVPIEPPKVEKKPVAPSKPEVKPEVKSEPAPEVKPETPVRVERPRPSEPTQQPLTERQHQAREAASNTGLLALSDELNDLVDSGDVATQMAAKVDGDAKVNSQAQTAGHNTDVITRDLAATGGAVNSADYGSKVGDTRLSERKVTEAKSELLAENKAAKETGASNTKAAVGGRSYEENATIIFDKNKSSLYALYDRERRKTPGLKGKIVLEITIAKTGDVTNVKIISSTLNNPSLEARIVSRIKQFKFGVNGAGPVTITYPIEFLPS